MVPRIQSKVCVLSVIRDVMPASRLIFLCFRFLSSSKLDADAMTSNLLSNMHCLETCEPAVYNNVLQQSLKHHSIVVPVLHNQVSFVFYLIRIRCVDHSGIKQNIGLAGLAYLSPASVVEVTESVPSVCVCLCACYQSYA